MKTSSKGLWYSVFLVLVPIVAIVLFGVVFNSNRGEPTCRYDVIEQRAKNYQICLDTSGCLLTGKEMDFLQRNIVCLSVEE